METLLHGLDQFKARGLQDKSIVVWTEPRRRRAEPQLRRTCRTSSGATAAATSSRASTSTRAALTNNKLLNTLITAAIRDKSHRPVNFGSGHGAGELTAIKA